MESIETVPQKVVDQKIIILKSRLDSTKVKELGEEKKKDFSRSSGLFRTKKAVTDLVLIGFSKYYEPFLIVGGRYSIDYCKKHYFEIKTDLKQDRFFVAGEEKRPEPYDPTKPNRTFRLIGEERCHYEDETFIVLDRLKRVVPIENVPLAPFEEKIESIDICDLKKVNITVEEEIEFFKSKIVNRPSNSDCVIREIFEINDRLLIYNPMYELIFQDLKTSEELILLIDGITGRSSFSRMISSTNEKVPYTEKKLQKNIPQIQLENPPLSISNLPEPEVPLHEATEINIQPTPSPNEEKESTEPPRATSKSEVESALYLAKDLLGRLGFKRRITPLKITQENDVYVVELGMADRTAKVLVNTKTKEVKEYDIQRSESF